MQVHLLSHVPELLQEGIVEAIESAKRIRVFVKEKWGSIWIDCRPTTILGHDVDHFDVAESFLPLLKVVQVAIM